MKKVLVAIALATVFSAACGDAADSASSGDTVPAPSTSEAVTTTAAPATTAAPTTTTPPATTTTAAATGIVAGEDPDVDAVVNAFTVAFDSESDFDAKAPYIDDPSGLEETVASYLTTGETMGGIGVQVSDVIIEGNEATVTYDLLFNGNPTYPDLTGTAVFEGDAWKVPRDVFCSLMTSARVGCPSE